MATTKQFRVKHGLDASNNNVSFVANPVNPQDAATKSYVDSQGAASNAYLTATFVTNTTFQDTIANLANTSTANATLVDSTVTFTREDGSTFTLDVTAIQGEVSNAYLTSTFTTNTDFQSYIANTNPRFAQYLEVANVSFAIQSDIDNAIANLVSTAPTTLDTLAELANALSNNENFATEVVTNLGQKLGSTASVTLTGDVTGSGSFSANAVSITTTDTNLANTNTAIADRMQVANVISYTAKYLEVANTPANTSTDSATYTLANSTLTFTRADSSTFDVLLDTASVEVSNTAPNSPNEGDLWWDSATGELFIYYSSNWVEAVAQDVTPYTNNAILTTSNNTLTFVRTDGSQYSLDISEIQGEVANAYLTSTFVTNADFQTTVSDVSDRMQVANTRSLVDTRLGSNALVTLTGDISGTAKFNANSVSITTSLAQDITIPRDLTVTRNLTVEGDFQVTGNATTIFANNLLVQDNFIYLNKGGGNSNIDFGFAAGYNNGSYAHAGLFRDATDGRFKFFDQYIPEVYESVDVDTTDPSFALSRVQANTFIGDLQGNAPQYLEVANVGSYFVDYWPSSNIIAYTDKYMEVANTAKFLEVANVTQYIPANTSTTSASLTGNTVTFTRDDSSTFDLDLSTLELGSSVTVSNTAPTGAEEGDLWWDNATGELYVYYSSNWVEAVAQDVTPYANNGTFSSSNNTITVTRTDGSQFDIVLTGVGEVSNSFVTSTFVTNTDFQSALANTNVAINDRMQVANVILYVDTELASLVNSAPATLDTLNELANALGNNENFATEVATNLGQRLGSTATVTLSGDVSGSASFSANAMTLNTTVSDTFASNAYVQRYLEVANVQTTDLTAYWPSSNIITYTNKYLEVANVESGAAVTVSNSAPLITANGDLWWDNATGELYVAYANNWVEAVAQDVTPYTNNATYNSGNTTITFTRTDGSQFDTTLDLTNFGGGDVSNSYLTATFVTNTAFQSYSANTNERFDRYLEVANANFAVQGDIDTAIANLVNTAPTTLDTLNELANALGDDPNFATTVSTNIGQKLGATATVTLTGDVSGSASFSANAVSVTTTVSDDFASNTYVQRYQEVANAPYVTANTIVVKNPDSHHRYDVTVASKTNSHPYFGVGSGNGYVVDGNESPSIILAPNQTYRFYQEDVSNSGHPVVFYTTPAGGSYTTGVTQVGTPGSAGAYTQIVVDEDTPQVLYYMCGVHANMGSVASVLTDTAPKYLEVANSSSFITSTALSPYLEVANVAQYIPANTSVTSALLSGNTATFTRADSSTFDLDLSGLSTGGAAGGASLEVGNTAPTSPSEGDLWYDTDTGIINVYVGTFWVESTVNFAAGSSANTSTTSATLSGSTATFTRADSSTFDLDLSGLSTGGGASVTVANTVPTSPSEGDLYFDEELATLFIYYDSSWVEVQPSQLSSPVVYGLDTYTANGTATAFGHTSEVVSAQDMLVTVDGIVQRPTTDYTVSGNTVTFNTAPSDTSIVAIRVQTGTYESGISNTTFQSYVANTNARINTLESGFSGYLEVTSNTTMVAGTKYIVGQRSANVVLTFPTSASLGDEVRVIDGTGQANTFGIELNRNGHRIQGELLDVIIDVSRAAGGYVYYNANNGWILTEV